MTYTVKELRKALYSIIRKLEERPERYARNPGKDFTRRRALTPAVLIYLILTMDEKSIWKGLLKHFQKKIDTPSTPAFVQQRQKLLPSAFEDLFHQFTDFLRPRKRFQGYRLLAVDGTSLKSMSYPEDADAYRPGTERQHGWNLFHINALYDLENGVYTDVLVQKEHTKHESRALCQMVERSWTVGPVILRPGDMTFDFLEPGSTGFYVFSVRIVRFSLQDGSTETLITNLDPAQFSPSKLKALYAKRWGIETSFRALKYTVGLIHLHSRKSELVLQEIFAAFTVFNFTKAAAWAVDTEWGHSKYNRCANFSHAVFLFCEVLRRKTEDITHLLERTLRPCRPNRSCPRPKISENRISPMYVSAR